MESKRSDREQPKQSETDSSPDRTRDIARAMFDMASSVNFSNTFPAGSIEARRPDHASRIKATHATARAVKSKARAIISGEFGLEDIKALNVAVSALHTSIKAVYSVETWAWVELRMKLQDAKLDPGIEFNPEVVKFIDSMINLVQQATGDVDLKGVLLPLERQLRSEQASRIAAKKNLEPRGWVRSQWDNRSDKGQSKASFARQYAPLVKKHFGVDMTPEQIARVWLPKG